jgi:hypothetical protein
MATVAGSICGPSYPDPVGVQRDSRFNCTYDMQSLIKIGTPSAICNVQATEKYVMSRRALAVFVGPLTLFFHDPLSPQ